jgi:hypothetical protein
MVQIYNEITIYIYKEIFTSGAHSAPNPPSPAKGVTPLCTTPHGAVYILNQVYSKLKTNTSESGR